MCVMSGQRNVVCLCCTNDVSRHWLHTASVVFIVKVFDITRHTILYACLFFVTSNSWSYWIYLAGCCV